jgi:hypothetical protein
MLDSQDVFEAARQAILVVDQDRKTPSADPGARGSARRLLHPRRGSGRRYRSSYASQGPENEGLFGLNVETRIL